MSSERERLIARAQGRLLRVMPLLESPLGTAIDVTPGGSSVTKALAHVLDQSDGEALVSARQAALAAQKQLDDGDTEEDVLEQMRALLGEAAAALEQADRHPLEVAEAAETPLRASGTLPALHAVARAETLVPTLRLSPSATTVEPASYEPLPPPTTLDELEDHGDKLRAHIRAHLDEVMAKPSEVDEAPEVQPVEGTARFVDRWARECFDEVAMLGSQRTPLPGEDWRNVRDLEDRLVYNADAFASLVAGRSGSRALSRIEALVLDAPAPDPWRLFAAGLLLGSLAGRDTLAMVDRLARASARDDDALAELAAALRVCPHPRLEAMLRDWLDDSDPAFRAAAAQVLVAKGALSSKELQSLTEDRREIAAEALMPLAVAGALPEDVPSELLRTAERDAAIAALAVVSKSAASAHLRGRLDDDLGWAAPWLATFGGREDGERILDLAMNQPTAPTLDAVAVAGLPVVERLLPLLSHDDASVALATARALDRITGAGLVGTVEIAPEQLVIPELPEPNTGGFIPMPPSDMDEEDAPRGSPDRVEAPPPDEALWSAWWREHRDRFEQGRRYRRGEPLSAQAVWRELDGPTLDPAARARAAAELATITPRPRPFDVRGWVVEQEAALVGWGAELG